METSKNQIGKEKNNQFLKSKFEIEDFNNSPLKLNKDLVILINFLKFIFLG